MRKTQRAARYSSPSVHISFAKEMLGLALFGVAVFLVLSMVSYSPQTDPGFFHRISPKPTNVRNLGGPVGSYLASLAAELMGTAGYLIPFFLFLISVSLMLGISIQRAILWRVPAACSLIVSVATLLSLFYPSTHKGSHLVGGIVGTFCSHWMLVYLNRAGAIVAVVVVVIASIMVLLKCSIRSVVEGSMKAGQWGLHQGTSLIVLVGKAMGRLGTTALAFTKQVTQQAKGLVNVIARARAKAPTTRTTVQKLPRPKQDKALESTEPIIMQHCAPLPQTTQATNEGTSEQSEPSVTPFPQDQIEPCEEELKEPQEQSVASQPYQIAFPFPEARMIPYQTPPLDLLDDPDPTQVAIDHRDLIENARIMEQKLRDFGVEGKVTVVHPGPIITLYEYEPAAGVKVNRIVTLSDDLAMALKAVSVRIVAPIPGKSVVGIEVPNPVRQKVYLKEILASETFQSASWKLPLALGKDIAGRPIVTDLSRMPHLLIAGATGTGKSVCLHSLILSLLFRFSPVEVRFLMIDPKMLELTSYQGIPHLLHPVITDPRKASDVLEWAVERMEQRYQLLSEKGVRNIETYNARLKKDAEFLNLDTGMQNGSAPDQDLSCDDGEDYLMPEQGPLPYIVIVIDEMADLMIISGRQIEEAITRLAQMARAAGIHLLLATQRPSVDVLTGIIKANLPTRISFQVSSRIDSRTILDTIGAEKLLGQGDMLFLPPGTSKVRRIHGAYVHEAEIERVVQFLKRYGRPRYEKIRFTTKRTKEDVEVEEDEKYQEAVQLVVETRQASISMIQRRLRVGYNRAARMIEKMEQDGIVGPQDGVRPREVLISKMDHR